MSSFSCPHIDFEKDFCLRLKKDCVPGRPGCVLVSNKYVFAVPTEKRIMEKESKKKLNADKKNSTL